MKSAEEVLSASKVWSVSIIFPRFAAWDEILVSLQTAENSHHSALVCKDHAMAANSAFRIKRLRRLLVRQGNANPGQRFQPGELRRVKVISSGSDMSRDVQINRKLIA